tara:strand:+ start:95 stop:586 length:492 start_codon:yes stop_codon:yes gene_type:complete
VNRAEAEQYFEENLSIEVKVLNKKVKKEINLVELNLNKNTNEKDEISISSKEETTNEIKVLSNKEVAEIKTKVKNKKKKNKIAKRIIKKDNQIENKKKQTQKTIKLNKIDKPQKEFKKDIVYKKNKDVFDVCTILEKCSIDEISKYLIKEGKKKDFPDIMTRQ